MIKGRKAERDRDRDYPQYPLLKKNLNFNVIKFTNLFGFLVTPS